MTASELIDILQAAETGSDELSLLGMKERGEAPEGATLDICEEGDFWRWDYCQDDFYMGRLTPYTTSHDAAWGMLPEGWEYGYISKQPGLEEYAVWVNRGKAGGVVSRHKCPILAMNIADLKARGLK